ncbi:hypothetical protein BV20DRAFT_918188, partial [Pilatotrama ljubarskyi]
PPDSSQLSGDAALAGVGLAFSDAHNSNGAVRQRPCAVRLRTSRGVCALPRSSVVRPPADSMLISLPGSRQ